MLSVQRLYFSSKLIVISLFTKSTKEKITFGTITYSVDDECDWLQLNVARRGQAQFTIGSGRTADYKGGRRPRGVAGGYQSSKYAVIKAKNFLRYSEALILVKATSGEGLFFIRGKMCLHK